MYGYEYSSQSWVYNEREMPLEPRPTDITEWSGEQYCFVIDSLLQRSIANPSALSALRIGDYADIIEADQLTQIFYPTLFDFVCINAASIMVSDATPYYDVALASALKRGSIPAEMLWRTKRVSGMPYEQRTRCNGKRVYRSRRKFNCYRQRRNIYFPQSRTKQLYADYYQRGI